MAFPTNLDPGTSNQGDFTAQVRRLISLRVIQFRTSCVCIVQKPENAAIVITQESAQQLAVHAKDTYYVKSTLPREGAATVPSLV